MGSPKYVRLIMRGDKIAIERHAGKRGGTHSVTSARICRGTGVWFEPSIAVLSAAICQSFLECATPNNTVDPSRLRESDPRSFP